MMARGRPGICVCALLLTFIKVALTHAEQQPQDVRQPVRDLNVSDIVVPEDLGYIVEAHQPDSALRSPIIVHIQEAHTNYEGQRHLIGILERFIDQYELKLILVEGGEGDVGLSYLRSYGPPDNRKQVAEKYLKAGILSGEEYLDIVSDDPLMLWGVEQRDLYQRHVDIFLEAEALRASLKPTFASLHEAIDILKPRLLDPALQGLERNALAFEAEEVGLADYADDLKRLAQQHGIAEEAYPQLAAFFAVRRLEQAVQLDRATLEQHALIGELSRAATPTALEELMASANQVKAGTMTREDFYLALERLTHTAGLSLEPYPHLDQYVRYLAQRAQVKPTALADELHQLADRLREVLAATPASQRLATVMQQVALVEKLVDLQLAPNEYQELKALQVQGLCSGWGTFIHEQLNDLGLPSWSFEGLEALEANLPILQRFYEAANTRDDVLVEHAIGKLKESNERLAVLITGGFHSPRITQLLAEQGIGVVVVAPKVTTPTDEQRYRAVLKYKSGHGRLDDVLALADHGTGSVASPQ